MLVSYQTGGGKLAGLGLFKYLFDKLGNAKQLFGVAHALLLSDSSPYV